VVAAGLVAVLSGTALVLAMWSSSATEAGGVITTGELKAIAGTFEWAETTPDVASTARQSGTDTASLAQFHAMPGDSLEIRQGVEVKGSGENLRFDVEASWSGGSNAAISPLEAEYVVTNSAGQILAGGPSGVSLGTPVQIEGLTEGQHELFVVVTLTYPASSDLVYQASAGSSSQVASLPVLNFAAQQVRETS
jgi:alternate signal-mediated exported protein